MQHISFERIEVFELAKKYIHQIVELEKSSGLAPYPDWFLDHILFAEGSYTFGCLDNKKDLVGFAIVQDNYLEIDEVFSLYINDINIREDYRNKGLGTRLFYEIIEYFKKEGIDDKMLISLNAQSDNPNALSFYNKLGFKLIEQKAFGKVIDYTLVLPMGELYSNISKILNNKFKR